MANYYTMFSLHITRITKEEAAWWGTMLNDDAFDCDLRYVQSLVDDSAHLYPEVSGDVDATAELLQRFLRMFRPDDHFAFQWSTWCDRPRLDSFGGGAVVVTAKRIAFKTSYDALRELVAEVVP